MERGQKKATEKSTTPRKNYNIRRQFNPEYTGSEGEYNDSPSMTQPDQTLTVQQLLLNHSRGQSSNVSERKGEYFDTEIPRFDDITEAIEYKKDLEEKAKQLGEDIKVEKQQRKQERIAAEKLKKEQDLAKAKELLKNEPKPPTKE